MEELKKRSLNLLVRAYYDYQRERISMDGRLGVKKDGELKKKTPERDIGLLAYLYERREEVYLMEIGLEKKIAEEIKSQPLWEHFLKEVKGVGPMIAAVIITEFDIYKAPTASNLISFAGLAPGKDRRVKGQKCSYNQFLKAKLCGVLGGSFLKSKSPKYSKIYYDTKHRLESENWGTDSKNPVDKNRPKAGHQHNASIRKMIKLFLQDLYAAWREIEGLPVREPYCEEYLDKKHKAS